MSNPNERRYMPPAFKQRIRAYARNPVIPTTAEVEAQAHVAQHEIGGLMRVTADQRDKCQILIDAIRVGIGQEIKERRDDLGLDAMQAFGLAINAGWSTIVAAVDQLRQNQDPLSRSAYLAELVRLLQVGTWGATESLIYDLLGDGDEDKGQQALPKLNEVAEESMHLLLDSEGLGDHDKAYEHALEVYDRAAAKAAVLDEADAATDAAHLDGSTDAAAVLPPGLAGLSTLLDALRQIEPRQSPKDVSPRRSRSGTDSSRTGMLAIELRKGESRASFRQRVYDEAVSQGMPTDLAAELADAVADQFLPKGDDQDD